MSKIAIFQMMIIQAAQVEERDYFIKQQRIIVANLFTTIAVIVYLVIRIERVLFPY